MTLRSHLLWLGVSIGTGIVLGNRRRERALRTRDADARDVPSAGSADLESVGLADDRGADSAPAFTGISDVDPGPLTQPSAEAIDPEATEEAHEQIRRQRERLPIPGKNLP
jgi:hypothetical protein